MQSLFVFYSVSAATAAALVTELGGINSAAPVSARYGEGGRIELGGGEGHVAEEVARTAFLCRDTLFVGNGIFGGVDKILGGADDTDDGEDADGNGEIAPIIARIAQCALNGAANMLGNVTTTAATAAFVWCFQDLGTKYNGIHHLHNGNRCVGCVATELGRRAKVVVWRASEDADIAFTAEKNDLLFQYRNAFKFLDPSYVDAGFKAKLDIEFDIDGVKAAIEGNGCDVDLCPCDTSTLDTDVGCVRDNVVAKIRQQHADIFKAIPIPTGVENTVGLNADRVSADRGGAGEFVICHERIPPYKMEALASNAFL